MLILGLNRGDHDASACLVRDGELVHFINAERLTRKRHEAERVWEAAQYCLEGAGVTPAAVDLVVQNSYIKDLERFDALAASRGTLPAESRFVRQFREVRTIRHHLAHAYSGIGLAPYDECAVLVVDGIGQQLSGNRAEAESYFHFRNGKLKPVHVRYGTLQPDGLGFHSFDSLGAVYSMVSSYLFGHWDYCGKVMGLAPYGESSAGTTPIIEMSAPHFGFDLGFLRQLDKQGAVGTETWRVDLEQSRRFAFTVQSELERALVQAAQWLQERTGSKNLVIAGGVALNCVANRIILEETAFERVFVPPPAGDDGISIGCAFYGWLKVARGRKLFALSHPYYGRSYGPDRLQQAVDREVFVAGSKPRSVERKAALAIAKGQVLGWFQGASAMGPRALGDRSILADPRDPEMRDHLNLQVKYREPFRPYGASVLEERAGEFFETSAPCPYMTFAVKVRPDKRGAIPSVVHVDGTCRIQTVRREDNPRFHHLLEEFYEQTGIPLVINTSLNGSNEPIIETPEEAIRLFLHINLDALILGDHWLDRRYSSKSAKRLEELLDCRLVIERAFELVERRYPGGDRLFEVRSLLLAEKLTTTVSAMSARLLRRLEDNTTLRAGLAQAGIKTVRAKDVLKEIAKLHEAGWVRFLRADSREARSSGARRSSRSSR